MLCLRSVCYVLTFSIVACTYEVADTGPGQASFLAAVATATPPWSTSEAALLFYDPDVVDQVARASMVSVPELTDMLILMVGLIVFELSRRYLDAQKLARISLAVFVPALGLLAAGPVSAGPLLLRTETFDADPGWSGRDNVNGSLGNNFGFRASDETGGSSGAGEAGGTLARTLNVSYYADTALGGAIGLGNPIRGSGEFDFAVGVGSLFNNGVHIGHRSTSAASTDSTIANFVGIEFGENQGAGFRFRAKLFLSDGSRIDGGEIAGLAPGGRLHLDVRF